MLRWAVKQTDYPVAVRQPGGNVWESGKEFKEDYYDLNKFRICQKGEKVAVIAAGSTFKAALDAVGKLYDEGITPTLINPVFLSGIDKDMLENLRKDHDYVITLEDGVLDGGFGEKIACYYGDTDMRVICRGIPKEFLDRYNSKDLAADCHLTSEAIATDIRTLFKVSPQQNID